MNNSFNFLEMVRGAWNETTELLSKPPGKIMLLVNSVDQGNQETHQRLQYILEQLKTKRQQKTAQNFLKPSEKIVTKLRKQLLKV